jgi:hypothetical protein
MQPMADYEIQGPGRVCAATGRPLNPGDRFHTVLIEQDGKLLRTDYAAEAWPGAPPEGAVAHWAGRVPISEKPRKPVINDELLLDCLERLKTSADPDGLNFRYVAALLLMRRKRLRFEDVIRDEAGHDVLLLKDSKSGTLYQVIDPRLTEDQAATVQAEVFRVLGWS